MNVPREALAATRRRPMMPDFTWRLNGLLQVSDLRRICGIWKKIREAIDLKR